jgi:hypothetical protein
MAPRLLKPDAEVANRNMTGRVIVGLLWLTMLVVCAGAWSFGALQAERQGRVAPTPATSPAPVSAPASESNSQTKPVVDDDQQTELDDQLDLYGNPIQDAVSDYRIDFEGEVYERHAPQVEVSRLAGPSL